eukprot:27854-Amphidinium_carterae.1
MQSAINGVVSAACQEQSRCSNQVCGIRSTLEWTQLVVQDASGSEESEESEVQGRDQSQPEVTRVHVRAHQRTLQDGRVVNVRSHSRGTGKKRPHRMSLQPFKK